MARIRSVKPEIRVDEAVASWPREVRLAWIYLWGCLDDAGRGRDNLALLVAEMFPLDKDVTERKLDGWLDLMAGTSGESGEPPLCRYDVQGRRYLHVVRWRHQKISHPTPSRIPPCTLPHPSGTSPDRLHEASSPRARSGAPADQGSGSKGSGLRVLDLTDGLDLDRIAKRLGADVGLARKVAREVLSRAPKDPANSTAYVIKAIDKEPDRYQPTPSAPRFAVCDHGIPTGACPDCAEGAMR